MPPSPRLAGRQEKRPPPPTHQGIASHQGIHPTPRSLDKQNEAKDGTRGWRAVPARCLAHRASWSRCPLPVAAYPCPSRRISPARFSIPGRRQFTGGAYIPRRFPQLISSAPAHRLIRPTDRRSIRTGKQDGGRSSARHRITAPSRLRPVSSLVSAGGAKSVSLLSAGSVSGPRCPRPRSGARHRRRLGPAVITASKQVRAARPRSAPRIGRREAIGQRPSWPRHRHGGQASKTAAVLILSARPGPVPPLVSAPLLALDPSG